jgi:hypothetical protein
MGPLHEIRQKLGEMILVFVVTVVSLKSVVEKTRKTIHYIAHTFYRD